MIRGPNLTPYQRGRIAGARAAGESPKEIATRQKAYISTIRYTLKLDSQRVEGVDLTCASWGKLYIEANERHILRVVRKEPKLSYAQVKLATGVKYSSRTIQYFLKSYGITN